MNVLCCHDTLVEMSLSRACVGDFLLARGGGQISPGQWDIVGVISGHVFFKYGQILRANGTYHGSDRTRCEL